MLIGDQLGNAQGQGPAPLTRTSSPNLIFDLSRSDEVATVKSVWKKLEKSIIFSITNTSDLIFLCTVRRTTNFKFTHSIYL